MADLYNRLKIIRERAASTKAPGSQAAPAPAGAKAPTSQAAPAPAGDMAPTPTSAPGTPALPLSTGESNGWEPCADLVWRRRQLVPVSPEWWEFTAADLGQSGRRELLESLQTHCYIDTETTGLSGGSGTWAFLVGWCRIEGEQAEITQYFMQDLGGEAAMVAAMDAEIQAMGGIGSYNGSSFDLPLLRTRWAMSGREFPQLRHRDCLHPSRRLWKRLLDSCGMAQIESAVLGSGRQDDIPGALIPQLYFDYLRAGAGLDFPRRLGGVFRHHACDVFSLAMLDLLLRAIERQPLDARWPQF